jgi:hypothetical protein
MTSSCRRAGILLERRASGLAEGDALRLDEHLADCASCRADARILNAFILADATARPSRATSSGARVLPPALDQAQATPPPPRAVALMTPFRFGLLGAGALCAVAAIALFAGDRSAPAARRHAPVETVRQSEPVEGARAAAASDRVEAGMLTSDGMSIGAGEDLASDRRLIVEREAQLALAHARVRAETGSAIEWSARKRTLRLHTGSVEVAVDPAPRRLVRVTTDRFAVEVLGTEFTVDPGGVAVSAGAVRIVSGDGQVLVDTLGSGQSWRIASEVEGEPSYQAAAPARTGGRPTRELLARARALLAAGDAGGARQAASSVLDRRPGGADAGEARTLLAECALVEGDKDRAIRLYLQVANRHRKLAAGETALFLAGRIAADVHHRRAVPLLRSYLETYPAGRFHIEAARRIEDLGGTAP